MKIAIFYSYNGASFLGSQTQPNGKAVEDSLNLALRKVGIFKPVFSSSRTDAGVHALCQVSTSEAGDFWDLTKLKNELNRHLNEHINVFDIKKVQDDFHARFSAKARAYRYILAHSKPNPFLADFVYFCDKPDILRLNEALSCFKGKRDFSGFYKLGSNEKSPVRELYCARARSFKLKSNDFTMIYFKANGFLRSQVRLMVANALLAAKNPEKMELLKKHFNSGIPKNCKKNSKEIFKTSGLIPTKIPAPASGLYLKRVYY